MPITVSMIIVFPLHPGSLTNLKTTLTTAINNTVILNLCTNVLWHLRVVLISFAFCLFSSLSDTFDRLSVYMLFVLSWLFYWQSLFLFSGPFYFTDCNIHSFIPFLILHKFVLSQPNWILSRLTWEWEECLNIWRSK